MNSTKKSVIQRFLDIVEGVGNKLPHPTIMFIWLMLILLACTAILSAQVSQVKTLLPIVKTQEKIRNEQPRSFHSGQFLFAGILSCSFNSCYTQKAP